jgi:hypothetical protein
VSPISSPSLSAADHMGFAVVDDNLDLVNSQEGLASMFVEALSGGESRLSLEEQGEVIASRVAPSLNSRPAFAQVRRFISPLSLGLLLLCLPSFLFSCTPSSRSSCFKAGRSRLRT